MEGVEKFYQDTEVKNLAKIEKFLFSTKSDPLFNLRAIRDGNMMFTMVDGTYCRLFVDNQLVMSDTRMERISNSHFVANANGNVLIAGLGLGLIIHNIINKPEVTKILVVEKYQDVVDLVKPKFENEKLTVVCEDIFNFNTSEKFDTIYFDIWPDINTDNLEDIKKLHNKFKFKLNRSNPRSYMNSWMKEFLQQEKRKEKSNYW